MNKNRIREPTMMLFVYFIGTEISFKITYFKMISNIRNLTAFGVFPVSKTNLCTFLLSKCNCFSKQGIGPCQGRGNVYICEKAIIINYLVLFNFVVKLLTHCKNKRFRISCTKKAFFI